MTVNDDSASDGEVCPKQSMYAVNVAVHGTMRARRVTTGLRVRGPACENEESSAVHRNMLSVHLATGSMEFRPIFQPGT